MHRRTLELTPAARAALEERRAHDPRPYFRERCAALVRIADGWSAARTAREGCLRRRRPDTVCAWLERYLAGGLAGLAQLPRGHRGFSPSGRRRAG